MRAYLGLSVLLLAGCSDVTNDQDIMKLANAVQDPHQLLSVYAGVACVIAALLYFVGEQAIWRSVLNAVRFTGLLCAVTGPLFYVVYDNEKSAIAITTSGLIGLLVTTLAFWRELYPSSRVRVSGKNASDAT